MSKKEIYLNEGYKLAKCCNPEPRCPISGYYSYNNEMVVHKSECKNLAKVEKERITTFCQFISFV
jgi:(p)ppGpp synthase/HD superfamily hydrolase